MITALVAIGVAVIAAAGGVVAAMVQARDARTKAEDAETHAEANSVRIEEAVKDATTAEVLNALFDVQRAVNALTGEVQRLAMGIRSCPFYADHKFPERF